MRLLPLLALLAACAPDPSEVTPDATADEVAAVAEDAARDAVEGIDGMEVGGATLGREVRGAPVETITTEDGGVELGLTDAVLYSRLSDATRKEVAADLEAETEGRTGLGARIAEAVTDAVESGLATAVQVPIEDVADVRVEGDRLVIEMADGDPSPFESADTDGRPLLEAFAPADAERLADAFRATTGR